MADLPGTDPAKPPPQLQTRTATTRKHLRRDQALSRKSKGKVVATDSIKERQQKLKEERESKRATFDTRHQHIFSTVATKLQIEDSEVENFILDGDRLDYIDDFFAQNGSRCLLFYYEERNEGTAEKKKIVKHLYLTDGTKEAFTGLGLFFLRTTTKPLTTANIAAETFFGALESHGGGLLEAVESLLVNVFLPALKEQTNWGTLSADADGHMMKEAFLSKLSSFIAVLANARASIADAVKLSPCTHEGLAAVTSPADILAAAGNPDLVEAAEECTLTWCKEIQQILTMSEQMRRESDDVGPRAELEHWKKRMAKFDSLTTSIKNPQCRAIINVLVAAKSKVLQNWKDLDVTITDFTNEAKDNVKFLYTLERYCEPLYNCNPVAMLDAIPGLINAIRMINSYSRYYNTSEKMTALFVKVTNQMITACRAHITDSGFHGVWDQERAIVLKKLAECKRLNHEYQHCFTMTKEKLREHPEERPFDFSEMYIFGKFNNFCRRIDNIVGFLLNTQTYETLGLSRIEGIETYNSRFNLLVSNIKKKSYDPLEHRKKDFDVDYEDFKAQLKELDVQLQGHMEQFFENATSARRAIEFTQRFERLNLPCLDILGKWKLAVSLFVQDLQFVQSEYNKHKEDPPLARNLPPISGKIAWSRQLYRRISAPVAIFQKKPQLMQLPETRKAIKHFNRLARVLVEYELLFLQLWTKQIDTVKESLNSTVLVRHPDTKDLVVNFDPKLKEVLREIEVLTKMGLEIPLQAKPFIGKRAEMLQKFELMDTLVKYEQQVRAKIPENLLPLMAPHLEKVNSMVSPGLVLLRWTSLNLSHFADSVTASLETLELLIDRTSNMLAIQIQGVLDNISNTLLCDLPDNEPWTIEEFVSKIKAVCDKYGPKLSNYCVKIETAMHNLLKILLPEGEEDLEAVLNPEEAPSGKNTPKLMSMTVLSPVAEVEEELRPGELTKQRQEQEKRDLYEAARDLMEHYSKQTLLALIKCTRHTLETIKRRVSSPSAIQYGDASEDKRKLDHRPALKVKLVLAVPHIAIKPSLDEMQSSLNSVVQYILSVHKGILMWGQKSVAIASQPSLGAQSGVLTAASGVLSTKSGVLGGPSAVSSTFRQGGHANSFFRPVREHKEIAKLVSLLTSTISAAKVLVTQSLEHYKQYEGLWTIDRNESITSFMEEEPSLSDFEAKMKEYTAMDNVFEEEAELLNCGSLALITDNLKIAMKAEANAWKVQFGRNMNTKYLTLMDKIMEMIDDFTKRLARPIKDLDDVRQAMAALKEIRENEIFIDSSLDPIEESYGLMVKYQISVAREETEKVDTMRFAWQKLNTSATSVQDHLIKIQHSFKDDLLSKVGNFQTETAQFYHSYATEGPMVEGIAPREASDRVNIFQTQFDELWRKYQIYSDGEELFGLPVTDYEDLARIKKEFNLLQKLYGLYNSVVDCIDGYFDILWTEVDIEKINNELLDFQNKCRKLPKALKEWQAFNELKKKIDDFNETCPLLEMMSNNAMLERHWKRMEEVTGHSFDVESESFQLRNIMEAPILKFREDIEDICISAVKEKDIDSKLKQVRADWAVQSLSFAGFKTRGELLLRGEEASESIGLMEDSLMVLGSLMSNRYNAPFKKEIQLWVQKLSNSTEIIENWLVVQNLWVYLEAVFVGGDIAKQLPKEAKRFSNIDKSWVKIMTKAHENPNVVQCCVGDETMGQLLPHLLEQLELCQKSLTGYLEKKRLVFPRFFFVSDPALLEILGQASDSHTIQAHLLSVFDNIKTVTFHEKDYDRITHIHSREPETIELDKPVMAQGNVEFWLGALLNEALHSVHVVIKNAHIAVEDPNLDLIDFLNNFPAQIGILGIQFLWTRDSEVALHNARQDRKIMNSTDQVFLEMLNMLIDVTTQNLTKIERRKFETLITIHLHQRDIFHDLVVLKVKTPTDFEWLKQSRFYYREESDSTGISITDVDFIYQNEFLGCTERLVITPLTDRCYITLSQALGFSMGGSPAGPAGTGKTETVKDMGRALGKYVVVFNCSDQMDFRGLGRIYKGLAQSGSWGCFDEFNRIELPVLSVAAQQIAIVLMCKKEKKPEFIFTDGDIVKMNPEFGLFLTMNPGYAGRQELPENLKMNFRPMAMMVPDRKIIIRVKLASCGFLQNIVLSEKFYTLYKLCEDQLSKQVHYDFGLRNILSVLRTLGAAKRANPDDSEQTTVMRGLRDMNLSKLVDEDEPLFMSLINDLFPGLELEKAGYADLEAAIEKNVNDSGLINHPSWVLKLIQLYETERVRHGFMALGPTGTGKTTCIHTLLKAMTDTGTPHREWRMNPKAITAAEMFGRLDVATNDWTDGIFSTLWRRSHKLKKGEHVWLVMDGPVDTLWIENLNSVLDDNKTLTLANGDRIPMYPDSKLVFEPDNVDNASPATVSRNGMVYMSSSGLEYNPIMRGWLLHMLADKKITQQESDILLNLYEATFIECYRFTLINLHGKMKLLECSYIMQSCHIIEGLIPHKEDNSSLSQSHLERLYIFSLMWSVGALLELGDRAKMEQWMRDKTELDLPEIAEGSGDTIFEFKVDDAGNWEHWKNHVAEYIYPPDSTPIYASILVPNVDNVRTDFLIHTIAKQSKGVLLIGEQGTAKTVIIKGYMSKYNIEEHLGKNLTFSSATQPGHFQRAIESYIDKRVGTTYGPPAGKKCTVFIDDINMPTINEWGDQITNEIVRQLMEVKGFYSLEKPGDFTHIQDLQLVAAMIHPGGGRNDIPFRLKRQFSVFNCTLPSNASIDKIFGVIGMGHFCKERGFSSEVIGMIGKLIMVTRVLWQQTKVKMLPTPAKFHYVFNLRDLSRIWEGIINVNSDTCQDIGLLFALWKHECTRVIADRFTSAEDKVWFNKCIYKVVEEELGAELREKVPEEPYFVDFLRDPPEPTGDEPEDFEYEAPKIYEHIPTYPEMMERLQNFMAQYNETVRGSGMDLVFFKDAMVHLIKISRIIRTDRGAALLVGVGGSGKQSLTRLASYIANYKTFQIQLSRSYNNNNLLEDLKVLYRTAGEEGKGIVFLFTDNEIKDEGFLEYINNVLSSGEVSNLFARDEIDEINSNLIPVMKKEFPRRPPTPENLYDYFLTRARKNLHIVLCFSPIGEKFRSRSLKFPGLFSGCTMDWFSRWPKDALIAVAKHFVGTFEIECSEETKKEVVQTMGVIQDFVAESCLDYFERFRRSTHVTPKSYLAFINGYKAIYIEQKKQLDQLAERMNTGLEKLLEASESVAQLSVELEIKEKELVVANAEAEEVLKEVTIKAQAAEKVKASVQVVKDKAQGVADVISADKAVAEGKLEAAKPALEEAERALQTIKSADIATVRKLGKPPHLIMRIMDCVLLLFQRRVNPNALDEERPGPKPSWGESLKMMSQTGFLNMLQNFPKDTINSETVELMQPYFSMEDYNLETAKRVCGNVAGLCSWTQAMASFFSVNKEVLPLKANLIIQEGMFQKASAELAEANAKLEEKEKEVAVVRAIFEEAMAKKQALQDDADTCVRKMKAASALIEGLSGEKTRWTEQSKEFKAQIQRLVGNVLLASGFLSYCGPFNQEYRGILLDQWKKELKTRKIPVSEKLNLTEMLSDSTTIGEWNLQGLPNDELSVQNGIIVTKATRFPLLIDPQGQGKVWIKNKEAGGNLKITTLNHKYFRPHLEDCLSLGNPLIIEDVEEDLDPCLDNVLEKNFIKAGSTYKVKVGDKEVDVMKGFALYITTKLPNPSYTPEVYARTAIIDFTVTIRGLEDQLLGRAILTEKNELEAEKVKLMEEVNANQKKMKELEDNLLYRLTTTKGSLVDDESLIQVLRTTKKTAEEVTHNLRVAAETEIKINTAREEYRPVAARGSVLYFLIMEMSMVNVMYQTSLQQFLGIFDLSMARSTKSPVTTKRIANIIEYLTFAAFSYCIRGLYEEHRFLFTLLLALKIDMQKAKVKHHEFGTLIKGGAALDLKACPPKTSKWITDMTWLNLVELSKLPQFSDILTQVGRNDKVWKAWFDTAAPEDNPIPDNYNSLDTFRKLLLIRSWCPDRVLPQALKYISESMGVRFAEGVILNVEDMWMESNIRVPMVCFLSMGSDPTNTIDMLSRKHNITFGSVSMGQGQEVHARRLLNQCQQQGGWTLLQNTHLALDFLDELLASVLETEKIHDDFRLWLTTEVHPKYPINLLQASIKFTFEPPQGVKAGLKRTYTNTSQENLDYSNLPQWKPMYYTVAFLHTTVQERRKFGPLGWNIPYEYNQGDFNASSQYVMNMLDNLDLKTGISWNAVQYMIGEIQYGGRVTDDYDKRLLNTYARLWFFDGMFKPTFKFYKGYSIAVNKTIKDYLDYIDSLPLVDTPEIFGLHPNADITYQSNTANESLDTILSIQPKDSASGGGETRESIVYKQAQEMLDKLPADYIPHEVKARLQKMGAIAPMNIFLRQEIDRMQRVIRIVRSTLKDLQLAIDGTIIMSENLRDALDNIYDAKVPKIWGKISWDSSTIGFWYTELLERDTQFRGWVFQGRPNCFWMTGFFNPQGFVTAMRQEVTRAHKGWALDSVIVHNEMTKMMKEEVTSAPAEGVYVHGLYLDGGGWDKKNGRLVEPTPKVLFVQIPVVHIFAVNMKDYVNDPKLYACPVYKKPRRTDLTYITAVTLRSNSPPEHWILRGVALLCDTK